MPESGAESPKTLNKSTTGGRLFKNALFNSVSRLLSVIVLLATTPYLVRKLTVDGFGIFALMTSLVGYYGLLDLGMGQGLIKFIAQYRAVDNHEAMSQAINASLWVQGLLGMLGAACLFAFCRPLLILLHVPDPFFADAVFALRISIVGYFFTMLTGSFSSVLMGLQRYDLTATIAIISNIFLNILFVVLLKLGLGLREVVGLNAAFALVNFLIYYFLVRRLLPGWRYSVRVNLVHFRRQLKFSIYMFIAQLSSIISNYFVRFICGFYGGPAAVTLYVIPTRILGAYLNLLNSSFQVVFPFSSELGSLRDRVRIKKLFSQGATLFSALLFPVLLMMIVFAKPILRLWIGAAFAESGWLILVLLGWSTLIAASSTLPNLIALGLGYSRLIGIFSIFSILFYAVLLPLFTRRWGVPGTAWAMLISTLPGIVLVVCIAWRILGADALAFFKHVFGFHLIPCLLALIVVLLRPAVFFQASLPYLAGLSFLLVAFYVLMMFRFKYLAWDAVWKNIKMIREA